MKKNTFYTALTLTILLLTPEVLFAQATTFRELASTVIIPVVKGVARILFVALAIGLSYGVVRYFYYSDSESEREEIKKYLLWGVVGITVAFGLWGIVAILSDTLGWGAVGIPIIRPPQ